MEYPPLCPLQVETRINCPLSLMQTFWYRRLLVKDKGALHAIEKEVEGKVKVGPGAGWVLWVSGWAGWGTRSRWAGLGGGWVDGRVGGGQGQGGPGRWPWLGVESSPVCGWVGG